MVDGRQYVLWWWFQETWMGRNLNPTGTSFATAAAFRTISCYIDSSSTHDIYVFLQEWRLDDTRRCSIYVHSEQTIDAQLLPSNSSSTPLSSPSRARSHSESARTLEDRVQANPYCREPGPDAAATYVSTSKKPFCE